MEETKALTIKSGGGSIELAHLRKQIFANAAALFPKLVEKHLQYHKVDMAKPSEILDIITTARRYPETTRTLLICGSPMARETAIVGPECATATYALLKLLKVTGIALGDTVPNYVRHKARYVVEGGAIAAELLPDGVEFTCARKVEAGDEPSICVPQ